MFFVHGGAWGSGSKVMYRLLGRRFRKYLNYVTVIPNYRVYPEADVGGQVRDINKALKWTKNNIKQYGGDPNQIYIIGHSSGAQISMLLLFSYIYETADETNSYNHYNLLQSIKGFIGLNGPFDIARHIKIEEKRRLHTVSPMLPANSPNIPFIWSSNSSNDNNNNNNNASKTTNTSTTTDSTTSSTNSPKSISPSWQKVYDSRHIVDGIKGSLDHLEYSSPTHICKGLKENHMKYIPPVLIIHGIQDNTVPYISSIKFCQALIRAYHNHNKDTIKRNNTLKDISKYNISVVTHPPPIIPYTSNEKKHVLNI